MSILSIVNLGWLCRNHSVILSRIITTVSLTSVWNNLGWGYCPTNIPQWNQRYKVAYALLRGDEVVSTFVDEDSDLSQWLYGHPVECSMQVSLPETIAGETLTWAVALVDVTRQNRPAIEMAVPTSRLSRGWLLLNPLKIK